MTPFLPVRHLLEYLRRRLVNHLNAGEIRQAPDLLGQGAVSPLYDLLKAFRICAGGHEANFTTKDERRGAEEQVNPNFPPFQQTARKDGSPASLLDKVTYEETQSSCDRKSAAPE